MNTSTDSESDDIKHIDAFIDSLSDKDIKCLTGDGILDIANGSAKSYCDVFVDEGLILENSKGNLRLFKLNREDFAVKEAMRAYYLLKLKHIGIERLAVGSTSLAIYGSFARGTSISEAILTFW